MPRDEFLKLGVRQTASSLQGEMGPKWCPAALWAGKCTGGNSGGDTQHHGSGLAVQLLSSIALATAPQNGAVFFRNTRLRGWSHMVQPTVNGQRLAPPREPILVNTNTRIVQPSSLCRAKASHNALLSTANSASPASVPHSSCSDDKPHSLPL